MTKGENFYMEEKIMKFYTIDDLKRILDTQPCSAKTGYISYEKGYLIDLIKRDFDGEKQFLKRNIWNDEEPEIYCLNDTTPYSKEAENFAKSQKTHGGGRNLIVMNEAYYTNAYYMIENRYWHSKQDTFKRDTRKSIHNAVSQPVTTRNEKELRYTIKEILTKFQSKINKEISSKNDFLKTKLSQFCFYSSFYKASYVQRNIGNPKELLDMLDEQMKVMKEGLTSLPVNPKKDEEFIDNAVSLLSEKNYSDTDKITTIVERIYSHEMTLIQNLQEICKRFREINIGTYKLEEEIKKETEERIRSNKGIYPGSLIIQHASDNGLIPASFCL